MNIQDKLQELFPIHHRAGNILLLNADCMEVMKHIKDNEFELSCVDPPYGVKRDNGFDGFGGFGKPIARTKYKGDWDSERPKQEYFTELLRVSKVQIIWGGNFFADLLPASGHWVFWDKKNTMPTFGDGELAYIGGTKRKSVKRHELEYNGLLGREIERIHSCQKPVKLYDWLLTNYAEKGQKILDTHGGSFSSAIAAHYAGLEFVGIELDKDYFDAAVKRFEKETAQSDMFGKGAA